MPEDALSCKEVAEFLTEYLEEALPAARRATFEKHVSACAGCRTYLEQMRLVVRTLGDLKEDPGSAASKEKLLQLFRTWSQGEAKTTRKPVPLGINDARVSPGDHIAYFWETPRQFEDGVGFLEAGLRDQDACFVFGHEEANLRVLALLRTKGFDVQRLIDTGRLCVVGGNWSAESMLASIAEVFQSALAKGAPLLRLLGNIGWGRPHWPEDNAILEFEAKVTTAARQFPCVIVCMYDVCALPGRIILKGGFETHPLTVRDEVLRDNAHYVPVELFINRLRGEAGSTRIQ